ncbi:MAG: alcohol dehydrogenase catalytic domain-containing protein [Vampirovibrionales bacterium]|nr:alcohol dehydrogenase catalytic domain-containing protein [Vampirovibrionales bacterium]
MKAGVFFAPNQVAYTEIDAPTPGPGELVVSVDTALTCGTDVKCYRRGHPVLLSKIPSPFGHEFSGRVAKVGEGVRRFKVGDRVVAANSAPCLNCYYCRQQQPNLCESLDLLNGAYADFIKIPERIVSQNTYPLPEHLSFEMAAFCEPLAVSLRGVEMSGVKAGDSVAIIGLGPIGQLLVRAASLAGANVSAIGRSPDLKTSSDKLDKLALAERFGQASQMIDIRGWDLNQKAQQEKLVNTYTPEGRGFDVVIEAVGLPETWQQSVGLVRKGGVVNWFAGCKSGTEVTLDTRRMHYDEITVMSLFHHTPDYFKKALQLLADGDVDPRPLISERLPMAEFETALQRVEAGEAMKIALKN